MSENIFALVSLNHLKENSPEAKAKRKSVAVYIIAPLPTNVSLHPERTTRALPRKAIPFSLVRWKLHMLGEKRFSLFVISVIGREGEKEDS
ncbi:hypothetical protein TNCV_1197041 [Trichonephila clavipes]|uniref:Uncharacterized protein n=1 Tax=Trichonephila clavipes TaxID=2585209 RepID=A0A8X6S3L6_TRICX|nr:hypothetical protein TNCV_1197041 [Trichonephila clavipes]